MDLHSVDEGKKDIDSIELKQARLWSRIDELEEKIHRLQQRVQIIEQGLTLGISNQTNDKTFTTKPQNIEANHPIPDEKLIEEPKKAILPEAQENNLEEQNHQSRIHNKYLQQLKIAKDQFNKRQYGQACLAFFKIDQDTNLNDQTGEARFWLGKSWEKLKELKNAKNIFEGFVNDFPYSPLLSDAMLSMAKIELQMGESKKAQKRLAIVAKSTKSPAIANEAKSIISNLKPQL